MPRTCEVACVRKLKKSEKDAFVKAIDDDYKVHWMVDNIPVGMFNAAPRSEEKTFTRGFPVGFTAPVAGKAGTVAHYLNNHLRIIVKFHDDIDGTGDNEDEPTTKIVGFRVEPMSIKHAWAGEAFNPGATALSTCSASSPATSDPRNYLSVDKGPETTIVFTYDVVWERSTVEWSERWDVYLNSNAPNEKVHWFSITNSIMIVLFLSVMIAVILLRALRKDIAQYNDPSNMEEAKEESGWKLVHGDVFRPPATYPMLFSVFVGSGVQLCCMGVATLSFALLGLLSPANRGSLITAFILLFVFMGSFAGFYSSSIYKMFRGILWKQNTLMTAFFYPGVVFAIIFVLNLMLSFKGSSGAIPFGSLFTLLFLWFCVSVPLVFLGSFFGYKRYFNLVCFSYLAQSVYIVLSPVPRTLSHTLSHLNHTSNLPQRDCHVPRAHEPDPARHPPAAVVHAPGDLVPAGRHPALRRRLRRALLHHVRPLAAPGTRLFDFVVPVR